MIDVVYARSNAWVDLPTGTRARIAKGTHWPANDPIVRSRPELFSDDPRWGMLYSVEPDGYDAPIEAATANPGEKRSVRRAS